MFLSYKRLKTSFHTGTFLQGLRAEGLKEGYANSLNNNFSMYFFKQKIFSENSYFAHLYNLQMLICKLKLKYDR